MGRIVRPSPVTVRGEAKPAFDDRKQLAALQEYQAASVAVLPGDLLQDAKTDRQAYELGQGEYKPVKVTGTNRVDIKGQGSVSVISTDLTINTPMAMYQGVLFTGTLTVPATGVLMLLGCETQKPINVAAGGVVHAVLTHFAGTSSIINAGVLGDVSITGCHKTSTPAHVNVTIISET
jgi:hypothetical protein